MPENPHITSDTAIASTKFLELRHLEYVDGRGNQRTWEMAHRPGGHSRAVMILARLMPEREIILEKQFRPPAGKYVLEVPAGLMDPGEDAAVAALRELEEETGYTGTISAILPPAYSSAGLTDEEVSLVVVDIDSQSYRNAPPRPHPEDTEEIQVLKVPEAQLLSFIQQEVANGTGVDARLLLFAYSRT